MDCIKTHKACDVCGAPLSDKRWLMSDGRVICARCQMTSVFTPDQATALYDEMKIKVRASPGIALNIPTGLGLVDRLQLGEVIRTQQSLHADRGFGPHVPDPDQALGIFVRQGIRRGIYMLTGLPRVMFLQVACHEYTHAWQSENCPLLRDPLLQEGVAEWVGYKLIGQYGYTDNQRKMIERRDLYGEGLRWALDFESIYGESGVLEACRTRN